MKKFDLNAIADNLYRLVMGRTNVDGALGTKLGWFGEVTTVYAFGLLLITSSYTVFYYLIGSYIPAATVFLYSIFIFAAHFSHRFGLEVLATRLVIFFGSFVLAVIMAHTGGISSSAACWLLGLPPAVTAVLFRRIRDILAVTAMVIVLYFSVYLAEINGYPVNQLGFPLGSLAERTYSLVHFIFFAIGNALLMAVFVASMHRLYDKLQVSKEALQQTVTDLNSIFETINQAIFLIDSGLNILPRKSAHFTDIHGTDFQNLRDLVARWNVSEDAKGQILATLSASVGVDALTFEFNEHLLPRQVVYQLSPASPQKVFKVNWSPVLKDATVRNIQVDVEDISNLLAAEARAKENQERYGILEALLQIEPSNLSIVVREFEHLLLRARVAYSKLPAGLKELKGLIHTIKGNARSVKMTAIAESSHSLETLIAQEADPKHLSHTLAEPIADLLAHMRRFVDLYHQTLGRHGGKVGVIEVDTATLQSIINRIERGSPALELLPSIKTILPNSLGKFATRLQADIEGVAKELGKAMPSIDVSDPLFLLPEQYLSPLANILGHMLRNAMDHGIELPGQRQKKGKPDMGSIRLAASQHAGVLTLEVGDDGEGLRMDKLRQKAAAKGLSIDEDVEVANLIFGDNFSTREEVSMISGRGEGLSAAVNEVRTFGGLIRIEFTGPETNHRRPFKFVIEWPHKAA